MQNCLLCHRVELDALDLCSGAQIDCSQEIYELFSGKCI